MPATTPKLTPVLVTNAVPCGAARILMLYLDSSNAVKSAPDRTVKATFYNLGRDPNKAVVTADGAFVWTIENERGMYVFNVNLPEAGTWGAEFTTEAPGSPAETVRLSFPVRGDIPTIGIGQKAPASKTPTAADVGGDLDEDLDRQEPPIRPSTRRPSRMRSPRTSRSCSSSRRRSSARARNAGRRSTTSSRSPRRIPRSRSSTSSRTSSRTSTVRCSRCSTRTTRSRRPTSPNQWGLLSEPWIFAVDRNGVVRGSYEVTITPAELDAILPVIAAG